MRVRWILVVLFAGCADPKLPDQLVEGKHVRYHYWKDMGPPCPEALAQMDRFIEQLSAKVNRPAPADFRVDYYRVRDADAVQERCNNPRVDACAIANTVFTTEWTLDHEVVHAFLNREETPPSIFAEGAAVMFGCGPARFVGEPRIAVDLEPFVDNDEWSSRPTAWSYSAAGAFSKWLVDRHGLETFMQFYESTPYRSTRDEMNAKFRAAFGVELSDALAEWKAEPIGREGEFCLPVEDACDGAPDLAANAPETSARLTSPVTCVDRVSILDVGAPVTRLRFTASQTDRVFKLRPCDSTGSRGGQFGHQFSPGGLTEGKWNDLWWMLRPGRYSVTVEATKLAFPRAVRSEPGGTASIEMEGHGPVFGDSCSLEAITVPDDSWGVRFTTDNGIAAGGDAGVLRFDFASERRLTGISGVGIGLSFTQMCSTCVIPPDACTRVDFGTSQPWTLRGPRSFHFERREENFSFTLGLDPAR